MGFIDVILGVLGVFSGIASTISDFSGLHATLADTLSTIIEIVTGFFG